MTTGLGDSRHEWLAELAGTDHPLAEKAQGSLEAIAQLDLQWSADMAFLNKKLTENHEKTMAELSRFKQKMEQRLRLQRQP